MRSNLHFSRRAFTLIELLVVIGILALLMGLLFPAVSGVIDNAKRTQAKNDVTQIATAITAYETEYGRLPPEAGLIPILGNIEDSPDNPRGIVFLEVPDDKSGKSGWDGANYMDPWGEPYEWDIDVDDYDNRVAGPGGEEVRKRAIVWSGGNPKKLKNNAPNYVKSWE